MDINHLVHEGRTGNLRTVDAGGKTLISIGASALWYFEWIDRYAGRARRHIGVEYYMPKPDTLPEGVEWIENTAGDMKDVSDGVADILISGQNIEHLWEAEIVGFLLEAYRVLKPGGRCIVDSPNRLVTEHIGMSHPEHMVEFTPDEIVKLMELAGFDINAIRGIWLCRDPNSGEWMDLDEFNLEPPNTAIDRSTAAAVFPDHSYVWWLDAVRSNRKPDKAGLRDAVGQIFKVAWEERLNRLNTLIGQKVERNGQTYLESRKGDAGFVVFGPYSPLAKGKHRIAIEVRGDGSAGRDVEVAIADIVVGGDARVLETRSLYGKDLKKDGYTKIAFEFEVPDTTFGMQIRLRSTGLEALSAPKRIWATHLP